MILAIDLGNSNIVMGIYERFELKAVFRTASDIKKSEDEYANIILNFLLMHKISKEDIKEIVFSSVVPPLRAIIILAVNYVFNKMPFILTSGVKTGLVIKADNPNEVGADLIAGSVGVIKKYGYPSILVDLGTATKFIVINEHGEFSGAVIAPGVMISQEALVQRAAQLIHIELIAPKNIIGRNTPDSMNSGAIYGNAAMIDGVIKRIKKELGKECRLIATGGLSSRIIPYCEEKFIIDEQVVLDGLVYIYYHNQQKKGALK